MTAPVLVLLSGGMDSATALALAADKGPVLALSVDYGQRHRVELDHASRVAEHYAAPWAVLDLSSWGALLAGSALTDPSVPVPHGHYAEESMRVTIVPNRNATLLMAAVGIAQAQGADEVWTAVHAGDHAVYPDCRPAFVWAANETARLATEGAVRIVAPFAAISKTAIATMGVQLGVPYELTWSCYEGGDVHCGRCGTCSERIEAFADAGFPDPTTYLVPA